MVIAAKIPFLSPAPHIAQFIAMAAKSANKIRRVILTGAVAGITATGAWYGAGLKVQQERKQVSNSDFQFFRNRQLTSDQEKQAVLEASPANQLEQMESLRSQLLGRKGELQRKIDELTGKVEPQPARGR